MPVSRNRKNHAKRLQLRKETMVRRKKQIATLYRDMYKELTGKNESMIEMLNKEDDVSRIGYVDSLTPQQRLEQDITSATAELTTSTNDTVEITECEILDKELEV